MNLSSFFYSFSDYKKDLPAIISFEDNTFLFALSQCNLKCFPLRPVCHMCRIYNVCVYVVDTLCILHMDMFI